MDDSAERFAQLCDEHIWAVYGFFGYRIGSHEDAEYLTGQTFEQALGAWDLFDERQADPLIWLLTIARSLLLDHPPSTDPLPGALGSDPELEAALARLDDRDREVLALRFGAGLGAADIAAMTGLGLADVQQIISLGLRRLRGELDVAARR